MCYALFLKGWPVTYPAKRDFFGKDPKQLRDNETKTWKTSSQNSILFEIDGPYKAPPTGKQFGKVSNLGSEQQHKSI